MDQTHDTPTLRETLLEWVRLLGWLALASSVPLTLIVGTFAVD